MEKCAQVVIGVAAILLISSGAAHAQSTFADVPNTHWAAAAVKTLVQAGIIEGYAAEQPSEPSRKDSVMLTVAKVKSALVADKRLDASSITVDGNGATLTLTGKVPGRLERDMAGQIAARQAPGFKIVNRLMVAPKVRGR